VLLLLASLPVVNDNVVRSLQRQFHPIPANNQMTVLRRRRAFVSHTIGALAIPCSAADCFVKTSKLRRANVRIDDRLDTARRIAEDAVEGKLVNTTPSSIPIIQCFVCVLPCLLRAGQGTLRLGQIRRAVLLAIELHPRLTIALTQTHGGRCGGIVELIVGFDAGRRSVHREGQLEGRKGCGVSQISLILDELGEAGVQLAVSLDAVEIALRDAVEEGEVRRRVLLRCGLPGTCEQTSEGIQLW
jgi:hypothetical protein